MMPHKRAPAVPCKSDGTRINRPARKLPPAKHCPVRNRAREARTPCRIRGNAMIEVVASLVALLPFIGDIPLLGKQFDVSHKVLDAARYAVWERTVWPASDTVQQDNARDLTIEVRDRVLGEPVAGVLSPSTLRTIGVSENSLWRDSAGKTLIDYHSDRASISARLSD